VETETNNEAVVDREIVQASWIFTESDPFEGLPEVFKLCAEGVVPVDNNRHPYTIHLPWVRGGHVYATDGKIILRTRAKWLDWKVVDRIAKQRGHWPRPEPITDEGRWADTPVKLTFDKYNSEALTPDRVASLRIDGTTLVYPGWYLAIWYAELIREHFAGEAYLPTDGRNALRVARAGVEGVVLRRLVVDPLPRPGRGCEVIEALDKGPWGGGL